MVDGYSVVRVQGVRLATLSVTGMLPVAPSAALVVTAGAAAIAVTIPMPIFAPIFAAIFVAIFVAVLAPVLAAIFTARRLARLASHGDRG